MNQSHPIIIGETNTQFIDGDRSARYPKREEYVDSGIMFLNGESINRGTINKEAVNFITEQKYRDIKKGRIARNDILLTTRGNGIGDAAFVTTNDKGLINAQMLILRADNKDIYAKYLFYYITSNSLQNYILNFASGSAQRQIPIRDLKKIPIYLPKAQAQRNIAAILSAYDELIDNNQRRIALLEKMVEEIYREWFVRLRFPGHEKAKIVKGMPEQWRFDEASNFFNLAKGISYAAEELTDDTGHMPFINLKSFNRGGGYREDGLKYYSGQHKPEQVVYQNDVVMAVTDMTQDRAVIGQVARIPALGEKGAVISLDTVKLIPKNVHKTFLYAYMRYSGFANFIKEFANGANVLHLKPDLILQQKIMIPPIPLQNEFAQIVEPLYAEADMLGKANIQLGKMRAMLLPRLISGKLSVEHLNIQFPSGMEEAINT
ncbi:MAG TPA: restriction endonuclease subunit S [Nitrosomonas sp.]|nr:restriction endonuclease subunit S [Nitrosomonas sp.]HQX13194.1 restriction endonuclease subunit S [Nitrosomonas sp.]HRB21173.1 restriction endonuclease subunit S [Nitrosomonas sp.]HRB32084.1 restriction endonuclease subunit S [Nitrosomonas sp.]HRB45826.1 restriction endonuclease subunit S [Nitrosomonas sp.]